MLLTEFHKQIIYVIDPKESLSKMTDVKKGNTEYWNNFWPVRYYIINTFSLRDGRGPYNKNSRL